MLATYPSSVFQRPRLNALALAILAQVSPAALADAGPDDLTALPLEQLMAMEVFSASKFVQKSNRAPSSVTVISAADIRTFGWRTLGDVARSVRGLYVSSDRNYSYLGARGFLRPGDYNTRFLLQIDGNRINDAVYDQAPIGGEFPLELDLIERIEFVPGPGSSIYGSNAFFGVINVITKKAGAIAGARATLEAGQAGLRKGAASIGWGQPGGTEFLLAASRHRSAGKDLYYPEFDTPDQNNGVADGLDYERGTRLFASLAHGPLSLTLMRAERVKGVPTASFYQPFNDPRSATTDRQSYVNAAYAAPLGASAQLKSRLFWGSYDSFGTYVIDDAARGASSDGSAARWWGFDLSLVSTRFAQHTLLAGVDYQRDYRLHQYSVEAEPYTIFLDDRRSGRRAGLLVQDQIALGEDVLLNLGLRHDRNSGSAGVTSPRVALIWAATPATTFKAIHGTAFRAPNSYEKFYAYPGEGGQLPNPDLREEKIKSSELALVHQSGENARWTGTLFRNVVGNPITQTVSAEAPETRFVNDARVHARGAELEYEHGWIGGFALRTSYSWTRVGGDGNGRQINAPARLAKLNAAVPLGMSGWRAALEAQYVGTRRALGGDVGAFLLVNANLHTLTLTPNTELAIGMANLFDRRYADPGSSEHRQREIAQDGRRLNLRLTYAY